MASKKKTDPYPHRGTAAGDLIVGRCRGRGCGRLLRRGDSFVTLLGDILLCTPCNHSGNPLGEEEAAMT